MTEVLISDSLYLQKVISRFIADGKEHFHVVADFDRTLTKGLINWEIRSSLESIFESQGALGQEFTRQADANFNKYYPLEVDPTIPLDEKKLIMQEWRIVSYRLMIDSWLTKQMVQGAMQSPALAFRDWCDIFFDILQDNDIPLLIFSASGLWYDGISACLLNAHKLFDNISIISNAFIRDEYGKAIGVKEPIIHSFNKDETVVRDLPVYEKIKSRTNVLLLGDSPGDVHMADGFDYDNIIKIWFLNIDTLENRKLFQSTFDVVIVGDGDMEYVNSLIEKILFGM